MTESAGEVDYLGTYGVVIVPPDEDDGQWFVTLATWKDDSEAYVAAADGPMRDTQEEAMEEAFKVIHWLRTQSRDDDLGRIWQGMQDQVGSEEGLGQVWPKQRRPWDV